MSLGATDELPKVNNDLSSRIPVVLFIALLLLALGSYLYSNMLNHNKVSLFKPTKSQQKIVQTCQPYEHCGDEKMDVYNIVDTVKPLAYEGKLTNYQKWAIALGAMTVELNMMPYEQLSLIHSSTDQAFIEKQVKNVKQLLSEWWGVNDRESTLQTLQWLAKSGHSGDQYVYFYKVIKAYPDLLPEQIIEKALQEANQATTSPVVMTAQERNEQIAALRYLKVYQDKTGDNLIYAWDWGRFVFVTQAAYSAGYLSKAEALALIEEVGKRVRIRFHSWEEFGENYVIGRLWWTVRQPGTDEQTHALYTQLMSSQGTWHNTPWEWSELQ